MGYIANDVIIQRLRQLSIKQQSLADTLGISQATISNFFNNNRENGVSKSVADQISQYLGFESYQDTMEVSKTRAEILKDFTGNWISYRIRSSGVELGRAIWEINNPSVKRDTKAFRMQGILEVDQNRHIKIDVKDSSQMSIKYRSQLKISSSQKVNFLLLTALVNKSGEQYTTLEILVRSGHMDLEQSGNPLSMTDLKTDRYSIEFEIFTLLKNSNNGFRLGSDQQNFQDLKSIFLKDKIFISTPISGFPSNEAFRKFKENLTEILSVLRNDPAYQFEIYCPAESVDDIFAYRDGLLARDKFMQQTSEYDAKYFMSIIPNDINPKSGVFFDTFYRLGKDKSCLIFIEDMNALPSPFKGLLQSGRPNVAWEILPINGIKTLLSNNRSMFII